MTTTIGWDIGGVHLKAARVERGGDGVARVTAVVQEPCALWTGLDALHAAFDRALASLGDADAHAATMTGELVDYFASRAEGVATLATIAAARLTIEGRAPLIYAGRAGFVAVPEAGAHALDVASANWHATAALAGRAAGAALLVDIGSTTTDIVPVDAGGSRATGYTDAERLATGELVYTGAVRTMLMALANHVPFRGRRVGTMAEYFAVIADVHRVRGVLPDGADQHGTADGRGKSVAESRLRLSRMIGVDVAEASEAEWLALAEHYAGRQLDLIEEGVRQVLSAVPLGPSAPVVGCGVGRFIAQDLAGRLRRPYRDLADLIPSVSAEVAAQAANCAPAAAVGLAAEAISSGG
jgi:probable H4MPT-linked C1 transfer pathway protein